MGKKKWYKIVFEYGMMAVGAWFMAIALNLLLAPNVIAPGGITGFAVVINETFGIPIYLTNLAINIPLFIFGARILGKKAAIRTLYTTAVFTLILKYTPFKHMTDDLLLAAIFGGGLTGLGLGLVFYFGGTTGGTDLAGAIMNNTFPRFKLSSFMMAIDLVVVVMAGVVEQKAEIALYSVIALYISVKVVDMILEGPSYSKAFHIITDKPDIISTLLMEELERGVTALKGRGMYTGEEKDVLLCVVNRSYFAKVKDIITETDPNAFIMITEVSEVMGEGFTYDVE